jgi:pimeloyl-ACP methyl ester carboxylesterase
MRQSKGYMNNTLRPSALPAPARQQARASLLLSTILFAALAPLLAGCGAHRKPNLERIFAVAREQRGKRPVIVIPGILGTELVNSETGEKVWPSIFRSSNDGLELPLGGDLSASRDKLVAKNIVTTLRLSRLVPEVYIYHDLLGALKKYGGYREGDWDEPGAQGDQDTFYVFAYDWRRDNVESARLLVRRIEELKRKLGRTDLRFNIIAHSMGGLIARYAARYGDADLPEDDSVPRPTWAGASSINKIFMFGTPNEGSMDAFATLLEGYSLTEGLRRRLYLLNTLSREAAITVPSIFQLLPHGETARFLDENLQPLKVDIYDPAIWLRYNWSPYADKDFRRRFMKDDEKYARSKMGPAEDLEAYFRAALKRARRFHEALDVEVGDATPVALYAFGGDCEETLHAPVILRDEKKGRWVTLTGPRSYRTSAGRRMTEKEVTAAMYLPGDGRVTRRSLLAETLASGRRASSLFNAGLPLTYAIFSCGLHGDIQNNLTLQDNALTALVSEATK